MAGLANLNKVLRLSGGMGSTGGSAAKMTIPAGALPDWLKVGAVCVYMSQSRGDSHRVKIKAIEERKQTVLFTFEQDKRVWKRVPFSEIRKTGDGALRPVWKETPQIATCEGPPIKATASIAPDGGGPGTEAGPIGPAPAPVACIEEIAAEAVSDDDVEVYSAVVNQCHAENRQVNRTRSRSPRSG
mmetsp:Transcript_1785/g.5262  ORF Transcript_1785/g.5262 Transcript_1785/m.5262 type:complete len:186 (-) Transcript_1785:197-754(-)